MLNLDLIDNGLSLDLVNHTSSGLLILTGRTLPNQEVKFLNLKNLVGKSISDEFGKWKFKILKSQLINKNITILTKIKGEEISLPLSQVALNEFIDSDYKNVEIMHICCIKYQFPPSFCMYHPLPYTFRCQQLTTVV